MRFLDHGHGFQVLVIALGDLFVHPEAAFQRGILSSLVQCTLSRYVDA